MIKHHPKLELLQTYVAGELPAAISVMISAHVEMCPYCEQKLETLTKQTATAVFSEEVMDDTEFDNEFNSMIDAITLDDSITMCDEYTPKEMIVENTPYYLPQVLNNLKRSSWSKLGKLTRSRVSLEDGNLHTSLLHIGAGGSVPEHTHNGFEITLLLDGSFKDSMGEYQRGDFIWLDGQHKHHPVTEDGCLCLTVSSDSLHFTQGISKLLNPIGKFIY